MLYSNNDNSTGLSEYLDVLYLLNFLSLMLNNDIDKLVKQYVDKAKEGEEITILLYRYKRASITLVRKEGLKRFHWEFKGLPVGLGNLSKVNQNNTTVMSKKLKECINFIYSYYKDIRLKIFLKTVENIGDTHLPKFGFFERLNGTKLKTNMGNEFFGIEIVECYPYLGKPRFKTYINFKRTYETVLAKNGLVITTKTHESTRSQVKSLLSSDLETVFSDLFPVKQL